MAAILIRMDRLREARDTLASALQHNPSMAVVYDGLGTVKLKGGDHKGAQGLFKRAIAIQPNLAESYFNLASIERKRGNPQRALSLLQESAKGTPSGTSSPRIFWAQLHNNLGASLHALGRFEEAVEQFDQAISLVPDMVMSYVNKGEALRVMNRWEAAIESLKVAVDVDPRHGVVLSNLLLYKQNVCNWDGWDETFASLKEILRANSKTVSDGTEESVPIISPYQAVTFPFSIEETCMSISVYARNILDKAEKISPLLSFAPPPPVGSLARVDNVGGRLRVAYLSSDFGDHTTGVNVAGIFSHHNRQQVHCFAYATSVSDGSKTRRKVEEDVETFRDVNELSDAQLAFTVNADGIHILVDLNGHTLGARTTVLALRPSPITIFDQGFAGTSGGVATHFNADKVSLPPELARFHTESVMYMPFFANPLNNHKLTYRSVLSWEEEGKLSEGSRRRMRNERLGLGSDSFLLACFNSAYKLSPSLFLAWSRMLRGLKDARLWLLRWPEVEGNIRRHAEAVGIEQNKLLFTDLLPLEEHLQVKSALTDLYLDSFAFHGHGTTSQVLWAGIPVLSLPFERIGQRIGSALVLHSASCPLLARNEQDYISIAQAAAGGRGRRILLDIRERLARERETSPLFDLARYVNDYEALLRMIWDVEESQLANSFHSIRQQL
uniref:protein O-GlcNAc transferase n=1 Tax=Guillardia theta TaxID=55529 RepID=A0A7S4KDX3_GUITH